MFYFACLLVNACRQKLKVGNPLKFYLITINNIIPKKKDYPHKFKWSQFLLVSITNSVISLVNSCQFKRNRHRVSGFKFVRRLGLWLELTAELGVR